MSDKDDDKEELLGRRVRRYDAQARDTKKLSISLVFVVSFVLVVYKLLTMNVVDQSAAAVNNPMGSTILSSHDVQSSACPVGSMHVLHRSFDGKNDYLISTKKVKLGNVLLSGFSIGIWARRYKRVQSVVGDVDGGAMTLLSYGSGKNYIGIGYTASKHFNFDINTISQTTSLTYEGDDGEWHFWTIVYDASDEKRMIARDGIVVNTMNIEHALPSGDMLQSKFVIEIGSMFSHYHRMQRIENHPHLCSGACTSNSLILLNLDKPCRTKQEDNVKKKAGVHANESMSIVESVSNFGKTPHMFECIGIPVLSNSQPLCHYLTNYAEGLDLLSSPSTASRKLLLTHEPSVSKLNTLPPIKIFVYDLPMKWSESNTQQDTLECDTLHFDPLNIVSQYNVDIVLSRQLRSSIIRTTNADEADFFYIPALLSSGTSYATKPQCQERKITSIEIVLDYIRTTWPYWDRKNGMDHVMTYDMHPSPAARWSGQTLKPKDVYLNAPPILLYLESAIGNITQTSWMKQLWPFHPSKADIEMMLRYNIVIPYPVYDEEVQFFDNGMDENNHCRSHGLVSEVPIAIDIHALLTKERTIRFYFAGSVKGARVSVLQQVREYLQKDFHAKMDDEALQMRVIDISTMDRFKQLDMLKNHMNLLQNTQVCVMPPNDYTTSKRYYDAVLNLCVPLLIQDDFVFPFTDFVDHELGIIRIPEIAIEYNQIGLYLQDITADVLAAKRLHLAKIRSVMLYSKGTKACPGDAFHAIMWSLYDLLQYKPSFLKRPLLQSQDVTSKQYAVPRYESSYTALEAVFRETYVCLDLDNADVLDYKALINEKKNQLLTVNSLQAQSSYDYSSRHNFDTEMINYMEKQMGVSVVAKVGPLGFDKLLPPVLDWLAFIPRLCQHPTPNILVKEGFILFLGPLHSYLSAVRALQRSHASIKSDTSNIKLALKDLDIDRGYGAQALMSFYENSDKIYKLTILWYNFAWTGAKSDLLLLPDTNMIASMFKLQEQKPFALIPQIVIVSPSRHLLPCFAIDNICDVEQYLSTIAFKLRTVFPAIRTRIYWANYPLINNALAILKLTPLMSDTIQAYNNVIVKSIQKIGGDPVSGLLQDCYDFQPISQLHPTLLLNEDGIDRVYVLYELAIATHLLEYVSGMIVKTCQIRAKTIS